MNEWSSKRHVSGVNLNGANAAKGAIMQLSFSITRRLLATIAVSALIFCAVQLTKDTPVQAKSYERRLGEIRSKKKNIESDLRKLKNEKGDLSVELKNLDKDLLTAEEELEAAKESLKAQEAERDRLQSELDERNADLDDKRTQLGERSLEIYKHGDLSYLDLVFGAEDFGDFINRVFFLQIIYENDQSLIEAVKNGISEVTLQQVAVNQKINEIKDTQTEIQERIEGITDLKDTKKSAMNMLEKDIDLYERGIKELEQESARIQRELA